MRTQKDNYKLSLYKERFRTVKPILSAYSYFEGGLNKFIREFIFENNDSDKPEKGYGIKNDLQNSTDSFLALFFEEREVFEQFARDYDDLLGKARVMCQNIPKKQSGNDSNTLIYFYSERSEQAPISKEELIRAFPNAEAYINDFCNKQAEFINRYGSFINNLKEKFVIK